MAQPVSAYKAALSKARQQVKDAIVARAKSRRLIYYSELAALITAVPLEAHDVRLFQLLCDVSTEAHENGQPLLSALVVHKSDEQPGAGFYELADSLGFTVRDKIAFWAEQVRQVHDHWAK